MKDWILFSIEVFQAMLTPVIGITTAYIAWQQYRIAREKARHERYERRVKIFKETMLFMGCAKTQGNISDEQLHSLLRETSEAKFLFGKDVQGFITTLYENGVILQSLNSQLESSRGPQSGDIRSNLANERKKMLNWFETQFEEGHGVFEPYLSLVGK
jgi:hypothetical protein